MIRDINDIREILDISRIPGMVWILRRLKELGTEDDKINHIFH